MAEVANPDKVSKLDEHHAHFEESIAKVDGIVSGGKNENQLAIAALRDAVMLSHEILMTQLAVVVAQVGAIRDDLDQYEEDKENLPHGRN